MLTFDSTATAPESVEPAVPTPSLYPNSKIPSATPGLQRLTTSIDIDPLDPQRLLVAAGVYNWPYGAYYFSSDGGRHWNGTEDLEFGSLNSNKFSQQVIFGDFRTQCCGDWNALYGITVRTGNSQLINLKISSDRGVTRDGE